MALAIAQAVALALAMAAHQLQKSIDLFLAHYFLENVRI